MTIKQLSVFLENKSGRINEVTKALGEQGINMHAFSMAETTDFGILRLIVSDVDKAVEVLRAKDFAVILTWPVRCLRFWRSWPSIRFLSNICMPLPRETGRISLSGRAICPSA